MRSIKFRAIWEDTRKMIFGHGICVDAGDGNIEPRTWIMVNFPYRKSHIENFVVIPETVGQYTGLTDINGVEIYEGDIFHHPTDRSTFVIVYSVVDAGFKAKYTDGLVTSISTAMQLNPEKGGAKLIGNIHQNPELLNT